MKLTRASSYALHAVTFMAAQKHDHPTASHHIAQARHIPADRGSSRQTRVTRDDEVYAEETLPPH